MKTKISPTVLILRTCDKDMKSRGGFQWPNLGLVEAPDWSPTASCGQGLHGLLWGEGDGSLLDWSADAKWLVCEVEAKDVVDLGEKVKFPAAKVMHVGNQLSATQYLSERAPGKAIVGLAATAGDNGQATAGYYGQATAGDNGKATAGDNGKATAGYYGQATAGDNGQATAGNYGQATAGDNGQATAGNYGKATAGYYGQATAGDNGVLVVEYFADDRRRLAIGYVGEAGIEANVAYRVLDGKLVRADK